MDKSADDEKTVWERKAGREWSEGIFLILAGIAVVVMVAITALGQVNGLFNKYIPRCSGS